jgi:hypothetical protein
MGLRHQLHLPASPCRREVALSDIDNGSIRFTVKELLARMDTKLDSIVTSLEEKADQGDYENLEKRVRSLELWRSATVGVLSAGVVVASLLVGLSHFLG